MNLITEYDTRKDTSTVKGMKIYYIVRYFNVMDIEYHYIFYTEKYKVHAIVPMETIFDLAEEYNLDIETTLSVYLNAEHDVDYG